MDLLQIGDVSFRHSDSSPGTHTPPDLFIIYGSVTMLVGIVVVALLPDSPSKAWFFSKEEKEAAIIRLAENQTGLESRQKWQISQVVEALKDPKYWCVALFVIAQSITNAGITNVRSPGSHLLERY